MYKAQISQQSLNLNANSQIHNSQISANVQISLKKSREREMSHPNPTKQNESKHMNAIKPYVNHAKDRQRKVSKRQSQKNLPVGSPYLQGGISSSVPTESNSKNKSKKETSLKKLVQQSISSKNIGDLYTELITIKAEYKTLKNSYNGLIKQNTDLTERGEKQAATVSELKRQIDRVRRQQQKSRNHAKIMEQEIERIKKQCVRMIQTEKFKNKKLEQTLQEKQLMIAYLRSQLSVLNGEASNSNNTAFFFQHTAPSYIKSTGLPNSVSMHPNQALPQQWPTQSAYNRPFIPNNINKSTINNSAISSIHNISGVGASQLIDLPRQINISKKKIDLHKMDGNNVYQPFIINSNNKNNEERLGIESQLKNKREYIFSNEDDSLSFSYEKSKQSIKDHEYESVHSEDASVLTFTKKDVYVVQQQQQEKQKQKRQEVQSIRIQNKYEKGRRKVEQIMDISIRNRKNSIGKQQQKQSSYLENQVKRMEIDNQQECYDEVTENDASQTDNIHIREDASSYTGEEQILTFQNRYANRDPHQDLISILNPHLKQKKKNSQNNRSQKQKSKQISKPQHSQQQKQKQKQKQKKQISSKSKLLTKRLQINTDEVTNGLGEIKESSAETRKRPTTHNHNHNQASKTGKKKISRKRKSEEGGGGSIIKK